MRIKTIVLLMLILTGAVACVDKNEPAPLPQSQDPSSQDEKDTSGVLADCFITFEVSAWIDLDRNGGWDAEEPPLEGVAIRVNGPFASMLSPNPCYTDQQGLCQVRTWAPGECMAGEYSFRAEAPESYIAVTPSEMILSMAASDFRQSAQFGFAVAAD